MCQVPPLDHTFLCWCSRWSNYDVCFRIVLSCFVLKHFSASSIAKSKDDSYPGRLWCNYEMAVFAKTSEPHQTIIVPIWAPVWILANIIVCFLGTMTFVETMPPHLKLDSDLSLLSSWFWAACTPLGTCVAGSLPFTWFGLHKLQGHERMLDQMLGFLKSFQHPVVQFFGWVCF